MSQPQKKLPKTAAKKAVDLPDDEAIRKLFPKKVVDVANKEIDHKPKPAK
jgi:hypothetical protein